MSGIAAIIRFDNRPVEPGAIEKMTAAMDYRGPDGIRHWANGPVAIGQCMLRTTAESLEEVQPLANEDESLLLVMDGWLSNWEELRSDLLTRGARLRTRSDAELVLRAYELWGKDCPKYIDGEFSFVVWDARRQEGLCVRDHAGLRPLHYHWDGRRLVVATDIAGVLAGPDVPAIPNKGMMAEIMANEWYTRDETVWDGIMRPIPAQCICFGQNGMRAHTYWSPPLDVSIRYKTDKEYFEHYRELFADCVRRSSRTHLPLGCEVSGGLDSSAVFAMAHDLRNRGHLPAPDIKGYTFKFDGECHAVSEIEYARAVRDHVGADIREVSPFLPDLSWFSARGRKDRDIPPYPNGALGVSIGMAAIADGCRVILNGDGGDEWLEGAQLYYAEQLATLDWRAFLKSLRYDISAVGLQQSTSWLLRRGLSHFLPRSFLYFRRYIINLFAKSNDFEEFFLSPQMEQLIESRRKSFHDCQPLQRSSITHAYMLNVLNQSFNGVGRDHGARICARVGYDKRSPMLARRFIEFAFATPDWIRNRSGIGKYAHRRALAELLPAIVTSRDTKAEFSIAFNRQLDEMQDLLVNVLPGRESGYLTRRGMTSLFARYAERRTGDPMWQLWGIFGCENAREQL